MPPLSHIRRRWARAEPPPSPALPAARGPAGGPPVEAPPPAVGPDRPDRLDAYELVRAWRRARLDGDYPLAESLMGELEALTVRRSCEAWHYGDDDTADRRAGDEP